MCYFIICLLIIFAISFDAIPFIFKFIHLKNVIFWNVLFQELSTNEVNYRHDRLRHAICVPETCPGFNRKGDLTKEINRCYDEKFREKQLKGRITELVCETDKPLHTVDWFDIFVGFVLIFSIYSVLQYDRHP